MKGPWDKISISFKITMLYGSIVICVLAIFGHLMFLHEKDLFHSFINDNTENIDFLAREITEKEKKVQDERIRMGTELLSHACTDFLWNMSEFGIRNVLKSYAGLPEIKAIEVRNDEGRPFAAVWKAPEIRSGVIFPENFNPGRFRSSGREVKKENRVVGEIRVYYSNDRLEENIRDIRGRIMGKAEKSRKAQQIRLRKAVGIRIAGLGLLMILLIVSLYSTMQQMIFKPMSVVMEAIRRLSVFDLRFRPESERRDETGRLISGMGEMTDQLRKIISEVTDSARNVSRHASEISRASGEHAEISEEQSASVSEISATMEEFAATSNQIAENAGTVSEIAGETLKSTRNGVDSAEKARQKMERIHEEYMKNVGEIDILKSKTEEIADIMGFINDIADQTRLIAFNAAIEASSAGDAGKRFGVVASEIRRLADSVTKSTDEIEARLNDIRTGAAQMVTAFKEGAGGIEKGRQLFAATAEFLEEILNGAESTSDAVRQISLSTRQQNSATDQIVAALKEMAEKSEQSSRGVTHISDIGLKLRDISEILNHLIDCFVMPDGKASGPFEDGTEDSPADTGGKEPDDSGI